MKKNNIKMNIARLSIILVTLAIPYSMMAQIDTTNRYNESVIVVSGFDPVISDAFKINDKPFIKDTVVPAPKFEYTISPYKATTEYSPMTINPAKVTGEPLTKLYRNLIKAGFGNYTTPYLEVFLNNTRSSKYALGAHYKHLSSYGKIKDYAYSGYSDNEANLYSKFFFDKVTIESNLDYERNMVHYYGFLPSENPTFVYSNDDLKHILNYYGFSTLFSTNNTRPKSWKQSYLIKAHYFNDNYKVNEVMGGFEGKISKKMNLFKFSDNQTLNIDLSTDYFNNKMDTLGVLDNTLIKVSPSLSTFYKEYYLSVGFKAVVRTRTGNTSDFLFFPTLEARLVLVPKIISIFAGFDGDINRYSLHDISKTNPFISPFINLTYEHEKNKIYGGIQSSFSKQLDLKIDMNTSQVDGMLFFINDTSSALMNQFTTVDDQLTKFNVNAFITFMKEEKLSFILRTSYFQYSTKTESNPWHIPSMVFSLTSNYNLQNKMIFRVDGMITSGSIARTKDKIGNMINQSIKTTIDFNLGFEYRYSKLLSGFVNINNISANRNYYFYQYPTQRLNFIIGVSYSFGGDTLKKKK